MEAYSVFLGFGEVVPTNIPEDELLKESSLIKPTELWRRQKEKGVIIDEGVHLRMKIS